MSRVFRSRYPTMAIPLSSAALPTPAGWVRRGSLHAATGSGASRAASWSAPVSPAPPSKAPRSPSPAMATSAIVGARSDGGNIGAAWIYTRSNGIWTQQGNKLIATDYNGAPQQGWSVRCLMTAIPPSVGGPRDNGSIGGVWVYTRTNGSGRSWGASGRPARGRSGRRFRRDFRRRTTLMMGGIASGVGAGWVFTLSGGAWTQQGGQWSALGT